MASDEEMDAMFGYHQEPDTIEDAIRRIGDLESRVQHDATQIKVGIFWVFVMLCYLIYKLS